MKDFIKAYSIQLSPNFDSDCDYESFFFRSSSYPQSWFDPAPKKDVNLFYKLVDQAAQNGVNTILVFVGDAYCYESHPEISCENAWTKEELKSAVKHIKELGMMAVPMLNFSAASNVWMGKYRLNMGSDAYLRVCDDLTKELYGVFDAPEFFHIGMNCEAASIQNKFKNSITRSADLLAKHTLHHLDTVRSLGAKPWMFSDLYLLSPDIFKATIEKDVLLSQGFIGSLKKIIGRPTQPETLAMLELVELGYDYVPTFCNFHSVPQDTVMGDFVINHLGAKRIKGILQLSVFQCNDEHDFKLLYDTYAVSENAEKILKGGKK